MSLFVSVVVWAFVLYYFCLDGHCGRKKIAYVPGRVTARFKQTVLAPALATRLSRKLIRTDGMTDADHVEHCLHQMVRFAYLAKEGQTFSAAQWGFNFGRVLEILNSGGGKAVWWEFVEPILINKDWAGLEEMSREWIELLSLRQPCKAFIERN